MTLKILCQSALAAVTLAAILTEEGHTAVWFGTDDGPVVATCAHPSAVMACIATTETVLRIPAHKRTRAVEVN